MSGIPPAPCNDSHVIKTCHEADDIVVVLVRSVSKVGIGTLLGKGVSVGQSFLCDLSLISHTF